MSISQAISNYLDTIAEARSAHTQRAYHNALRLFCDVLRDNDCEPDEFAPETLTLTSINWFAATLKTYAPASEQLYLTALKGFFEYLIAEDLSPLNLTQIQRRIRLRARRPGLRLPQFPKEDIEKVIDFAKYLTKEATEAPAERLRNLRDRAAWNCKKSDVRQRLHPIPERDICYTISNYGCQSNHHNQDHPTTRPAARSFTRSRHECPE